MQVLCVQSAIGAVRFSNWNGALLSAETVDFLLRLRYVCMILDMQTADPDYFALIAESIDIAEFVRSAGPEFDTYEKARMFLSDGFLEVQDSADDEDPFVRVTYEEDRVLFKSSWQNDWQCYLQSSKPRESCISGLSGLTMERLFKNIVRVRTAHSL